MENCQDSQSNCMLTYLSHVNERSEAVAQAYTLLNSWKYCSTSFKQCKARQQQQKQQLSRNTIEEPKLTTKTRNQQLTCRPKILSWRWVSEISQAIYNVCPRQPKTVEDEATNADAAWCEFVKRLSATKM